MMTLIMVPWNGNVSVIKFTKNVMKDWSWCMYSFGYLLQKAQRMTYYKTLLKFSLPLVAGILKCMCVTCVPITPLSPSTFML